MERNLKVVHVAGTKRKRGHTQGLRVGKWLILKRKKALSTQKSKAYLLLLLSFK